MIFEEILILEKGSIFFKSESCPSIGFSYELLAIAFFNMLWKRWEENTAEIFCDTKHEFDPLEYNIKSDLKTSGMEKISRRII